MEYAVRINLKTDGNDRKQLIDFCLHSPNQCLAIGWSCVYSHDAQKKKIQSYDDYYKVIKNEVKRINHALNVFRDAKENDLLWTRDLDGYYWICRVINKAQSYYNESMDIGAVLPVEAYKVGLDIPGQIKASFNRPKGGTAESIKDETITEFSKYIFNIKSGRPLYEYNKNKGDFLNNLPDFELEEFVISYLQLKENYYVLSNSIAKKSTTIRIECELISRDISNPRKAVVQVKGGYSKEINALDFQTFSDNGYLVYLFAPKICNKDKIKNIIEITKEELLLFYKEYRSLLPDSITKWENLFSLYSN